MILIWSSTTWHQVQKLSGREWARATQASLVSTSPAGMFALSLQLILHPSNIQILLLFLPLPLLFS